MIIRGTLVRRAEQSDTKYRVEEVRGDFAYLAGMGWVLLADLTEEDDGLQKLREAVWRLNQLLVAPEPGLFTFATMLDGAVAQVSRVWNDEGEMSGSVDARAKREVLEAVMAAAGRNNRRYAVVPISQLLSSGGLDEAERRAAELSAREEEPHAIAVVVFVAETVTHMRLPDEFT